THARQLPFVGSTQREFQVQFAFRFLDQPAAKFYWICTHSHTCAWDAPDALRRIRSGRYTSAEEFDPQRRRALRDDHSPQRGARQALEFDPKRSYVMQWNLSAARQISSGLVVTLGYVGSRGVHLPYRDENFDMVLPALTPAGYLFPPAPNSQKLNLGFARITGMLWQANSFYDALHVVITK